MLSIADFHNKSFHGAIEPLSITTSMIWYDRVALRVRTDEMKQTLAAAEKIWKKAYPTSFYKPEFLDDKIAGYYKADALS